MTEEEIKKNITTSARENKRYNLKKPWESYVTIKGKQKYLRYYYTEEEARDACREYRFNLLKESAELPLFECKIYKGYFVFPNGQIFRNTCIENRPQNDGNGYLQVAINGKLEKLHRILALCFIPNDAVESKSQVNHINGVKDDNRLENLEWCTSKENTIHARDVLSNLRSQKLTREEVKEIKTLISEGYKNKEIAEMYNIPPNIVSQIRCGKSWKDVTIDA